MFRPVPLLGPDLEILVQVWLLGQGFIHVASLSSRIVTLRDLSQTILPYCVGENRQQLGSFLHTSTGWGLQSIQRMIADAGFHLASSEEESISQTRGEKQVDRLNEADLANGPESEFEAVAAANVPVEVSPGKTFMLVPCPETQNTVLNNITITTAAVINNNKDGKIPLVFVFSCPCRQSKRSVICVICRYKTT